MVGYIEKTWLAMYVYVRRSVYLHLHTINYSYTLYIIVLNYIQTYINLYILYIHYTYT